MDVINLWEVRERRRRWSVTGLAVAASLALGLSIGGLLPRNEGAFRASGDQLAAAGALGSALERQLAAAGEQDGIRIGLTFKDTTGRYCRTFTAGAQSGLACRAKESWSIEGLMRGEQPQGDYRMASGQDPAFATIVESQMVGEPVGTEAEARLVEQRWRD